jgi:hypothetical protein
MLCSCPFTLTRRVKHCYHCGWLVCVSASPPSRPAAHAAPPRAQLDPNVICRARQSLRSEVATQTKCSPDMLPLRRWLDDKKPHTHVSEAVEGRSFSGQGAREMRVCRSCYQHAPAEWRVKQLVRAMRGARRRSHLVCGPILTEIHLCHACSCHEMLSGNAAAGAPTARAVQANGCHALRQLASVRRPPC